MRRDRSAALSRGATLPLVTTVHAFAPTLFVGLPARIELEVIDEWNARRARVAAWYDEHLPREVLRPCVPDGLTHVYHLYVMRHPQRDAIAAACKERKVDCAAYYTTPLQRQPVFAALGHKVGDFPATDAAAEQNLAIPMHPNLSEAQVQEVAAAVAAGLA